MPPVLNDPDPCVVTRGINTKPSLPFPMMLAIACLLVHLPPTTAIREEQQDQKTDRHLGKYNHLPGRATSWQQVYFSLALSSAKGVNKLLDSFCCTALNVYKLIPLTSVSFVRRRKGGEREGRSSSCGPSEHVEPPTTVPENSPSSLARPVNMYTFTLLIIHVPYNPTSAHSAADAILFSSALPSHPIDDRCRHLVGS